MTNAWTGKARWTATVAAGAALVSVVALGAASAPAAAAAPTWKRAAAPLDAQAHGSIDTAALRAALAGLPEPSVRGAMVRISGLQKPQCVRPGTPVEVVRSAVSCGTPTTPGTTVQYNGINYFLAGLVIEKATGRSYGAELRDRIVRPLGLRHTRLPADDWAWAEGGLVSTAGDLTRFMNVLMRGGLHRPAERASLFTMPPIPDARFSYGGLMRTPAPGGGPVVWGKTGTNRGYTSGVFATPDLSRVVVYSTLTTGQDTARETERVMGIVGAAFKE
ncbi:serine hydrolase domain-containing protein [Streptomyces sp. NPDC058579]|uniref:serine hydrolase domain-containing protein n=1 Tax=Streptomyces sp. NPDC058579 TaxID=3346548 RepID=UPI0036679DA4